ncbi:MAG TPA: ABC transporter permease subunit [Acidobacteriota bacterium]|jgi:NitT/TauT family transport system permease protein|nr:ABC transporter permease subunit [Acidobacteriota bacterium]
MASFLKQRSLALLDRSRRFGWVDLLVVVGLAGLLFGLIDVAHEWRGTIRPAVEIDLSPRALPQYTFFSLSRGLLAYVLSFGFTLVYGYWAAKDQIAERVLIPLLDILQSIPVLGFMPGLVLALVALFPSSNVGLELAAILMIFTGQAWNMTFSFYHSLRSVPQDQREVCTLYRFGWWQRLKWVELPFSVIGLVWNSMMSMAGGWFFLMINEAFVLGNKDFRIPGVGSYMSVAVARGNVTAMIWAIVAMTLMIVLLDQLLWRPVVVWAQKFRVEEGGQQERMTSFFLDWLRRSHLLAWLSELIQEMKIERKSDPVEPADQELSPESSVDWASFVSLIFFLALLSGLGYGAYKLVRLLEGVSLAEWRIIVAAAFWTLGRVLLATALGTVWALPAGIAIGLSPKLSRVLQPAVQVVASFPAPMLFPLVIAGLKIAGVSLGWGSILLMLLGTQWYILFNVVAGAMAIPSDLREAARSYRMDTSQKFWNVYLPAVFPYLVTGWVTAAGGAWNASIVAEFVTFRGEILTAWGLGAQISRAADTADFPMLAASVLVMSAMVVIFNRTVWRRCYRLAEERFSLSR